MINVGFRARLRDNWLLRHLKRSFENLEIEQELRDYRASEIAQKGIIASWRQLQTQGIILPFDQVGFSRFSEFEEDGILLYLMTLAGTRSRTIVEISSQDGRTCMASNLIVHHQWRGYLFDGDPVFARHGRRFFGRHPATAAFPPVMQSQWFTRDNINEILASVGVPKEIDILSLDIDGNDLYLWDALLVTRPRILVCEINNAIPSGHALTIPYSEDFDFRKLGDDKALYRSASLDAYITVGRRKGYRFVGMNALGFNAIFLRDDVLESEFPERCSRDLDTNAFATQMRSKWWHLLCDLPWIKVDMEGGNLGRSS